MNDLQPLTLSVAQPLSVPGQLVANVAAHVELIKASQARVVVFPELSLVAYDHAVAPISLNSTELQPLREAAARYNSVALVGAPVKIDHHQFISFIRIDVQGINVVYLKTCMTPDEHRVFDQGVGPKAIEVDGWRIGLAICRDTWNKKYMERYAYLDLDLIVAGVLDEPEEEASAHKIRTLMARQLRIPMGFARTAGPGPVLRRSSGRSVIYSHTGTVITQTDDQPGSFARTTLKPRR